MATTSQSDTRKRLVNLLAGSTAGVLSNVALQPFDVLKTRLIVHRAGVSKAPGFISLVRDEGFSTLWRGSVPTFLRVSCGAGLYFAVLAEVQNGLRKSAGLEPDEALSPFAMFAAGFASRGAVGAILTPITVIKTRVEATAAAGESLTMRTALKNMLHEGRLSSFYRGTVPTVLRDAPFSGIYAATFSFLKSKTENLRQDLGVIVGQTASSLTVKFGCGISAGALATLVTQPADVVRTRLQLAGFDQPVAPSIRSIALTMLRDEGVLSFFRGFYLRLSKRSIATAITWTLFDELQSYYQSLLSSRSS